MIAHDAAAFATWTRRFVRMMPFVLASACVPPAPPAAPSPPPRATLNWIMPSFTPTAETQPIVAKGGVSLGATPAVYQRHIAEVQRDSALGNMTPGINYSNPTSWYIRSFRPSVSVTPSDIAFTLTVINNLDRVFRSAGAVISLNVDGRTISFDQSGISEFLDVVLVPRAQAQVTIDGPPLSVLQPSGTIALFVYDVVVAVDAAGNPTAKENWSWYYTYTMDPQSQTVKFRESALWCRTATGQQVMNPRANYPSCY